jgi:hypothetical protein
LHSYITEFWVFRKGIAVMNLACPKCREPNIRRSHRQLLDFILRSFGMIPLRCNLCEHRFFRFRRSMSP